jgi:hypothetical protein
MNIAVAHIIDIFGRKTGSIVFDAVTCKFRDTDIIHKEKLPEQSQIGCETLNNNIAVIVGVNNDNCVVCFGDNYLYSLSKESLSTYTLVNANISKNGSISYDFDKPADLSHLFGEPRVMFVSNMADVQSTSLGVARKFFGRSEYGYCVAKFSKYADTCLDLDNEIFCYEIACILGIRCCRVFKTIYGGRDCILSIYEYNKDKDIYRSFRQTGLQINDILKSLDSGDRAMFVRYLIFDYLTKQQDRHLSNLALVNDKLYPLFDNGDCFGVGFINEYSKMFRDTVKRLSPEEIYNTLPITVNDLKAVKDKLPDDRYRIFMDNFKECYKQ